MSADLASLVRKFGRPRVLVVGDLCLDCQGTERLAGAGSVAAIAQALGARVAVAGVVGPDDSGRRLRHLFTDLSIDYEGVITDQARPTAIHGRSQGRSSHEKMPTDCSVRLPIREDHVSQLGSIVKGRLRQTEIVLISDHNRGVCVPPLLAWIISNCRALGLRVIAGPMCGSDFRKYHGASAITPSRSQAGLATGRVLKEWAHIREAASHLVEELDLEAAVVNLDKDGIYLSHADGRRRHVPSRSRSPGEKADAGDMIISTLAVALACGADYEEAMALASRAGDWEGEINQLRAA
jgi:D-beta-D-heptose 7-phosphate kinase/D-beta-D-heptose 1-phosphate adenosyltransferase